MNASGTRMRPARHPLAPSPPISGARTPEITLLTATCRACVRTAGERAAGARTCCSFCGSVCWWWCWWRGVLLRFGRHARDFATHPSDLTASASRHLHISLAWFYGLIDVYVPTLESSLLLRIDSPQRIITTTMGQEISEPIDESVEPYFLARRDLKSMAEYIASEKCNKIAVMVGAGISTSAGIPDFRSPDTGLYANLKRLDLPEPEAVFDISYFRKNPLPFYTLAHDLYPGRYRPTITHSFIRLLHDKGLLARCWTQNIDTLERAAGVPGEKLIEAHGSFASQRCVDCKEPYPDDLMRATLTAATSPPDIPTCISTPQCGGLVKPDIVFFGEPLPATFVTSQAELEDIDLAIVMGTSLTVFPFASLPMRVPRGLPRLLINKEKVGELGSRSDDVILLRQCDEGVRELCAQLGWLDELEALWAATETEEMRAAREEEARKRAVPLSDRLDEEVDKLTRDVEQSLKVSQEHKSWVETLLEKEKDKQKQEAHSLEVSGPDSPILGYKAAEPAVAADPITKDAEKEDEVKKEETKEEVKDA
ncbi:hypothetical protein Dda_3425 [Drechslerella dactyloides]|uniref:Deacetylase sirtuin-type domain-containing protein n=1 Tax=Drechslerella dactyloides TaxID=74499 RepID=A0AAD6NL76_DREDA|nr:hypothetical protein Dda_3425 [Drechslerella dactyloides]